MLEWLNDTVFADESFFVSLFRHPGTPGGVPQRRQPEFITRGAVEWYTLNGDDNRRYGYWLRGICVQSLADLSWLFEPKLKNMLFIQKIDFDYDAELVDCLYVRVQRQIDHPFRDNGMTWVKSSVA